MGRCGTLATFSFYFSLNQSLPIFWTVTLSSISSEKKGLLGYLATGYAGTVEESDGYGTHCVVIAPIPHILFWKDGYFGITTTTMELWQWIILIILSLIIIYLDIRDSK